MAVSSRGFTAQQFDFRVRRPGVTPLHRNRLLELRTQKRRRRMCSQGDLVGVTRITCCSSDSVVRVPRTSGPRKSVEKAEEWRFDSKKIHRRTRLHATPAMPFASPQSRFVSKQEKFYPRCAPRNSGPQSRDTPPKRDTGIANEKDWGISLLHENVNESGTNEDGSTWYRESGEDLGENGYRCRWSKMGGRSCDGSSEWKETNMVEESIWPMLVKESLKALGGLGLLSLGGKYLLRRVFEVVAEARSSEAFVALCLLTVAGTSLLTQKLGFSDTLGAFLAGALLAETNFRTQIEADIRPFRGLLLGLFFVTTGTSIDIQLLFQEWPNVLSLLAGLIVIKTLIITAIGPRVGLTLQESVRIGLLLSQGGEFGFVVFSLANRLGVLPLELNKLLIIVVVLSMALTPLLNDVGRRAAEFIDNKFDAEDKPVEMVNFNASEPVVILGFGQMGQVLANFLSAPLASGGDADVAGWPYVAFDIDPSVVKASRKLGFPVLYGDGSRPAVLQSAGITSPKAVMVMYTGKNKTTEAVRRLRLAFPAIPVYARAQDLIHLLDLKKAGATDAILENAETSLQLGSKLLKGLGVMSDDVTFLSQLVRDSMELQAQEALSKTDERELDVMKPMQVRVADLIGASEPIQPIPSDGSLSGANKRDATRVLNFNGGIDQADHDDELQDSEDLGKGVLYCELNTENNFPRKAEDFEGKKATVDSSTP